MLTSYKKLKDAIQRGGALLGAATLLAGTAISAVPASVFADALNPLTERSLTLSSSSPGWSYLDGSGNATYAYPNSGANGQKTGNTFSFRVSSTTPIKAVTFQYCTTPAGTCLAPGDNTTGAGTGTITLDDATTTVNGNGTDFDPEVVPGSVIITAGGNVYTVATVVDDDELTLTANPSTDETGVAFTYRDIDSATKSDLNVQFPSMTLINSGDWSDISNGVDAEPGHTPEADGSEGEFVVLTGDAAGTGAGTVSTTTGDPTVTGVGTSFLVQLVPGSTITVNGNTYTVLSITSNTSLELTANASANESGEAYTYTPPGAFDYTSATDWAVTSSNVENGTANSRTGKKNFITMTSTTGIDLDPTDYFKVIFFGTDANYITNPGSGAFFVRINTYSATTPLNGTTLIDGGVTVANVMNESITITTKVLETMAFSVGTFDPNKYDKDALQALGGSLATFAHGQCSTLLMKDPDSPTYATDQNNLIRLGLESNEFSLATDTAYDGYSYWRLSSNSSGGATVYYTGHTLTNTVGDEIMPLDETLGGTASNTGTEQFGLGIATGLDDSLFGSGVETYPVWENNTGTLDDVYGDEDGTSYTDGFFGGFVYNGYTNVANPATTLVGNDDYVHYPRLYPLVPVNPYGDSTDDDDADGSAAGSINDLDGFQVNGVDHTAKFAFSADADTWARPIATESSQVVNCVTAKMRYIANIAATTPAGIYTTKINYVAAPQY